MSTVILKKDCDGHKAGEKISVPYTKGQLMIRAGLAAYPDAPSSPPVEDSARIVARLRSEKSALESKAKAIEAENRELKELLSQVTKPSEPNKTATTTTEPKK